MPAESTTKTLDNPGRRTFDLFEQTIDRLHESAGVDRVFGEPITAEGKTIVPIARVAFGFGGGLGGGPEADPEAGEGGGGGGGVSATAVGALEVTEDETRFVRFGDGRRLALAVLAALGIGWLLGRR